jgi:hypothetical protein
MNARHKAREAKVVEMFLHTHCHRAHGQARGELCDKCRQLLDYSLQRLAECPHDPKPRCSACPTPCYAEPYRTQIREAMKFSGVYFAKRGRLDLLLRYLRGS